MKTTLEEIQTLISDNKIEEALFHLSSFEGVSQAEVLLQRSRFNYLNSQLNTGTISFQDGDIARNKIVKALLMIVSDFGKKEDSEKNETGFSLNQKMLASILTNKKKSLVLFWIYATLPLVICLAILSWSFFFKDVNLINILSSLTLFCVSGYFFKEIMNRNNKISTLSLLSTQLEIASSKHIENGQEIDKIKAVIWTIIENNLTT